MDSIIQEKVAELLNKHKGFFETGKTRDIDFRLTQLDKLKKAILKNENEILDSLNKDLGKSQFEGYTTEVGILLDSIGFAVKNLKKWSKAKRVKTPITHFGSKSYIYYEPYGTVLIIGPFNYPFQLIFEPLLGALTAGNCAVIKPSTFTPNVSKIVSKIISETFDERYVSVIEGNREVTTALINSPFDYIFFTGSVEVGKVVMEAAAKNLVPVTLELGGKSPCIVDKSANLEVAAKRIAWGKYLNLGQTCVAPDYLLIHRDIKNKFIELIKKYIKEFYGENPKESKDYGKIINEKHAKRIAELIDKDKVILGGEYDLENLYISPTIMDRVTWQDKVMGEEIFGPILPILEYENVDDAIKMINQHPKPLALYVFTEDSNVEQRLIKNCSYGGGCVNDTITHLATPHLPFGGVGNSGIGSYHGEMSFKTFSHSKSVLKKSTSIDMKFLYPPYDSRKLKLIKKFLK